jgi:hypothetical protein
LQDQPSSGNLPARARQQLSFARPGGPMKPTVVICAGYVALSCGARPATKAPSAATTSSPAPASSADHGSTARTNTVGATTAFADTPTGSASAGGPAHAADIWVIDNTSAIHGVAPQLIGAPSIGTSPRGAAVCFDGDDGIVLGTHPLEGLPAFALEVYLRIDGVTNPALATPRFLHIETETASRALMEARVTQSDFHLDTFLLAGSTRLTLIDSSKVHPVGRWTWAALTYADGQMRHFVNGVEDASGAITIPPLGPGKMSLGVRQNLVHYFSGCIRELRVTPAALPAAQLQRATP